MGTRAQAFTAKIRNLQEIQMRLVQGSVPLPQGHEIANSLKYFSATLVSFIKMRHSYERFKIIIVISAECAEGCARTTNGQDA